MINTTFIAIALFVNPVANMDDEIVSSNLQRGGGHIKVDKVAGVNIYRGGGHVKVDKKKRKVTIGTMFDNCFIFLTLYLPHARSSDKL